MAIRQYELAIKSPGVDTPLMRHWRGQAEMYAAAIIALRASREEHDYNYSGGI
jgi:hypothetical protein